MIEEIRISDLGVITEATLPLGPGLTVVTGETGAGKTMVVTALGLLLGARADAGAVRAGAASAVVESTVRLAPGAGATTAVRAAAEDAGAVLDDAGDALELLIARTVSAEGRSRAHAGGRTVPVGVLAGMGQHLVAVHGQSDQLRLASPAAQRTALDAFAGAELAAALGEYQRTWRRHADAAATLRELTEHQRERLREAESLQAALEEIDTTDPQPGEDDALRAEALKLGNIEQLRIAALTAHQALVSDGVDDAPDVARLVDAARRALEAESGDDEEIAAAAKRVAEVGYLVADIASDLAGYSARLDESGPARLAEVEDRRAALTTLTRRYGSTIDEVLDWAATSRTRLDELTDDSSRIEALQAEVAEAETAMTEQAATVTALRAEAADRLATAVSSELTALAMKDATLVVRVEGGGEPGPHGADEIAMLLQPHAGSAPRPLGKGASGGELSRVMLALEVVLAQVDPVPTFVFDEVDAGVGGKAAVEIGRRLARLARHVQVIVVTHLPQVAAFADRHIRVLKTSDASAGVTTSDVSVLDAEDRVVELARMLAGQEQSATARAHARELLEAARA
ncbi:DNA repair protein RecN [Tersicoccus solisilvae]|uniref:DNA repair protein RecN n=1 Tax=Tersicoccus solisilvae TaxID=1882339 RepID=A0ABQ1NSG8_9MICC|nr:DNA repair protein RecN [Tersicoccus solisilvae]GGC83866.1 DNA repair protein RecN [Tersicoccus solisilvae]